MMLTSHAAARLIGARVSGPDVEFDTVVTDSRGIRPRQCFVAIRGDRFDGHAFVADVLGHGAAVALVEEGFAASHPDWPLIAVGDTRAGFAALAAAWRRRFTLPVIGVVGSNGKTTTKEMCAAILRAHFGGEAVLATTGNLNNDIGLPAMALRLNGSHRAAVLEIGMNHPGETTALAAVAQATIALVNNAQREHQEFMQSVRAVAEEHAILVESLPADGIAVFNADDEHAALWRWRAGSRQAIGFGLAQGEVRGRFRAAASGGELQLATPWGGIELSLRVPGEHNARNACGAAAACLAAGVSAEAVRTGLSGFGGVKGRLQERQGRGGTRLIDDSYNANPDSMRAAIDVLAAASGRRVFVMGDMGEVGDNAGAMHEEIGAYAKRCGIGRLLALGEWSRASAACFGAGGQHFDHAELLVEALERELGPEVTVLVKGSRFMRMERIADAIADTHAGDTAGAAGDTRGSGKGSPHAA